MKNVPVHNGEFNTRRGPLIQRLGAPSGPMLGTSRRLLGTQEKEGAVGRGTSTPAESVPRANPTVSQGSDAARTNSQTMELFYSPEVRIAGSKIRVLLVDDHHMMREALAHLLQCEADIQVVGEAVDGQNAVDLARQLQPDVIVMDISMPRLNGIEATRQIMAGSPRIRVIGLSMHEEGHWEVEMRAAGAVALLNKLVVPQKLISLIRKA